MINSEWSGMAPMHFSKSDKIRLLNVARQSLHTHLNSGQNVQLNLQDESHSLVQLGASFVTLKKDNELRGCIGHLQATQPLIVDVAHNAIAAATQDFRFQNVELYELPEIEFSISVLSPRKKLWVDSEDELIKYIREKKCGLVLTYQSKCATFLPSVWESLKTPEEFIGQLKQKAGLAEQFWSDAMEFEIYYTFQIP